MCSEGTESVVSCLTKMCLVFLDDVIIKMEIILLVNICVLL